jgi:hypothetical protein
LIQRFIENYHIFTTKFTTTEFHALRGHLYSLRVPSPQLLVGGGTLEGEI